MRSLALALTALVGAAWMWWRREDPFVREFDAEQWKHVGYYSPDVYG